jgi:RimJ/RimL family protein N-acetyltransferase
MAGHLELISDIVHERVLCRIAIADPRGKAVGCLVPLTTSALRNPEIVQKLTDWRNRARESFLTRFTATADRTRDWLQNVVMADAGRLLFLIQVREQPIGQFGFKGLSAEEAELDNLIRGERGGGMQLIPLAEVALVRWLFLSFEIARIRAFVLAHNQRALDLHLGVGFRRTELLPLRTVACQDEVHLTVIEGSRSPEGLYYQKMELTRKDFSDALTASGWTTWDQSALEEET